MRRALGAAGLSLFFVFTLAVCGGGGEFGADKGAEIRTTPSKQVTFPTIPIQTSHSQPLQIQNAGSDVLTIESIEIRESDADDKKEFHSGEQWFESASIPPGESKSVQIKYKPLSSRGGQARLLIENNAINSVNGTTSIRLSTPDLEPQLFSPSKLSFRQVPPGETNWRLTEVKNTGQAPLKLKEITLDGSDNFRLSYPDPEAEQKRPQTDLDQRPTSRLAPGESFEIRVWFEPDSVLPEEAELIFRSNEPDKSEYIVDISGNSDAACIKANFGEKVNFGDSTIGKTTQKTGVIQNCSEDTELKVSNIELTDDADGIFQIDANSLPNELSSGDITIDPGERISFVIRFSPESQQDYEGQLEISSNSPLTPTLTLPVKGTGIVNECPTAVATGQVDSEGRRSTNISTVPLATVQLSGEESSDPDGSVTRYEWSLIQKPDGSTTELTPNGSVEEPELYLDLQGTYKVELKVYDNRGQASCGERAMVKIEAIPQDDIHVQLTWDTPSDPDQTNQCGSDLDLHYLHPNGDWRHPHWDVYFENKNPDWGEPGVQSDDPRLDIDDTDGAGPENVNHSPSQTGLEYQVGVYYYRAEAPPTAFVRCPTNEPRHYGASYATIRIYIDGQLYFEKEDKFMEHTGDFWNVTSIPWPAGN